MIREAGSPAGNRNDSQSIVPAEKADRPMKTFSVLLFLWMSAGIAVMAPKFSEATMYQHLDAAGPEEHPQHPTLLFPCPDNAGRCASVPSLNGVSGSPPPSGISTVREIEPMHVVVPVQRAGQLLVVQAYLNGYLSARLIIDTGASHTILSHGLLRGLGMATGIGTTTATLDTAAGSVQVEMVKLSAIRVGEAEVQNVPVAIHDLPVPIPGVDGLLGLTFLYQFLVALDVQKNELHLWRYPDRKR
jgi:clan AA aspartic protease (TIGR02281 family)